MTRTHKYALNYQNEPGAAHTFKVEFAQESNRWELHITSHLLFAHGGGVEGEGGGGEGESERDNILLLLRLSFSLS